MDETKEALGRLVIARFEQRRALEAARVRAARWRFVGMVSQLVLLLAAWLYFEATHSTAWTDKLSWSELAPLLVVLLAGGIWRDYRLQEQIQKLRWEVARLGDPAAAESGVEKLPDR